MGLNIGADDYVTKPFNPLEPVASEIEFKTLHNAWKSEWKTTHFSGGWTLHQYDTKEVTVDGEAVKLTPIEYNILLCS